MRTALRAGVVALAVAAVLAAVLSACSAIPATERATSPSTTPSATGAPARPVVKLVVGSALMTALSAGGGVVSTLQYTESGDQLVSDLTAVFGSAPATSRPEGGVESPPSTRSAWNGFALNVPDSPSAPYTTSWVLVEADHVGTVEVETVGGVQVGDSIAQATSETGAATEHYAPSGEAPYTAVYLDSQAPSSGAGHAGLAWRVFALVPDATGVIESFRAPSPNQSA